MGRSSQASWRVLTLRMALQTALLHLKPEPKAICQTRSPRLTPCFVSMHASTYLQSAMGSTKVRWSLTVQQLAKVAKSRSCTWDLVEDVSLTHERHQAMQHLTLGL